MLHNVNTPKIPLCEKCRKNPSDCDVWGCRLCYATCWPAWMADDRFSSEVINKHLGQSNDVCKWNVENGKRYDVEATKRTRAWLTERS